MVRFPNITINMEQKYSLNLMPRKFFLQLMLYPIQRGKPFNGNWFELF
jgi:hypothetical protein